VIRALREGGAERTARFTLTEIFQRFPTKHIAGGGAVLLAGGYGQFV
jgi:hypothetical protein